MTSQDSWQTAEIGGTKQAAVITKPEMIEALLKRAHRPVLVIGHQAPEIGFGDRKFVDFLIDLANARRMPVIATGHANRDLVQRGFTGAIILPAVEAGHRLCDPTWTGPDGEGPCDLVLIAGLPYPMAWTLLSGLRHFAPFVKTISLDPMYHPNAAFSFANIPAGTWQENLVFLVQTIGKEG